MSYVPGLSPGSVFRGYFWQGLGEPYLLMGITPRSAVHKVSALPSELSAWPQTTLIFNLKSPISNYFT